jgi:two-component system, LytTR family, response regulator
MKILIIEDEPLVAVSLSTLLKILEPGALIEGPLGSVQETKEWLNNHPPPDLILSDIQLSDGISLDIFAGSNINCPIIFTTAYNEYAIRAFKVNSIDYLLKPVEKAELQAALQKFHQLQAKFNNDAYLRQAMKLFGNFNQLQQYKERFAVHAGRAVILVQLEDTACFTKGDIIYLVNREGKKFITDYRSLDEAEELLDPRLFYRVTRQCLVQLSFIESFRADDTGRLLLRLKLPKTDDLLISKEKAADFKKWFTQ